MKQRSILDDIKKVYGKHCGEQMSRRAGNLLEEWGIDPDKLEQQESGANARIFTYEDIFVIKVNNGLENHLSETPKHDLLLPPLKNRSIGTDMGQVLVFLQVFPNLNTQDVEPEHAKVLCYELSKSGECFYDNKSGNVGLATYKDKLVPYIIDEGAIAAGDFLVPENSGYDKKSGTWEESVSTHSIVWPASQSDLDEYIRAVECLESIKPAITR